MKSIDVNVEREAFRLLSSHLGCAAVGVHEMSIALNVESEELSRFIDDPSSMLPFTRMRLATLLRERASSTADPQWTEIVADALWTSAREILKEHERNG